MNKYVNAIRSLGIQSIKKAKQGHPGMAISAAPLTYSIYTHGFKLSKQNPHWINRDRFVLSGGHGCMSLYPILHFCGFLDIEELKRFRQEGSLTPGHPEVTLTPFVEVTTGPLGQGLAQAVGLAIAQAYLEAQYDKLKGLIDHYTYCVVGDGDLQEGISYETMSLAGKLQLKKLIVLHDSNRYQLESAVSDVNTENIKKRVESMNWFYQKSTNDPEAISKAIHEAKKQDKPAFIEVKTIIGEGLTSQKSFEAHGAAISDFELKKFNKYYNIKNEPFEFDRYIYNHFEDSVIKYGATEYKKWNELLKKYQDQYPELVGKFLKQTNNEFIDLEKVIDFKKLNPNVATRDTLKQIMEMLDQSNVDDVFIISADISKSTNLVSKNGRFNDDKKHNFLMAGIREFGISGIQNGILAHRGLRCISSTFLAFSDYLKAGIRLGSISQFNSVYVFTHDSILIGSDGPTHQPIEQLAGLRIIPDVEVIRPADEIETGAAFIEALNSKNKTYCLVLTRQKVLSTKKTKINQVINSGGYPIEKTVEKADLVLMGSGSELELAYHVGHWLQENTSLNVNIFSAPNLIKFLKQKDLSKILEAKKGLVVIEASNDFAWYKLLENVKQILRIEASHFGESMDGVDLYKKMGFSLQAILKKITEEFDLNKTDLQKINYFLQNN